MPTDLVVTMSIWTSVRPSAEDWIDVAYSLHGDQIRLAFNDQTMMIGLEEAKKLAKKINIAIVMTENS